MSKFTTGSKYRYITGQLFKREEQYLDLNLSTAESQLLAASSKYLAGLWSTATNGSVAIIPLSNAGKRTGEVPLIHAHSSSLLDMAFSPFDDDLLATSGEDSHVRLWRIPELGLTESVSSASATLSGHQKKVEVLRFNPAADNVLATGSDDKTIRVWDIEVGAEKLSVNLGGESPHSISWNYDGSAFAFTSKEKKISIVDPRANSILQQGEGHQGVKPSRVIWLGDLQRLATTGFSKTRERQLGAWDVRNLKTSLAMTNIDTSTGVLVPLYDNDAKLLFLAGKGDTTIHYYEVTGDKAPYFKQLGSFVSDVQQRDAVILPKLGVDVWETEVVRIFKATPNSIVPVRFTVPRKSKREFAADLFPDTPGKAGVSSSEWFGGATKPPVLVTLNRASAPRTVTSTPTISAASVAPTYASRASSTSNKAPVKSEYEDVETPVIAVSSGIKYAGDVIPEDDENKGPEYVPKEVKVVRQSKFKHIVGKGTKKDLCYDNIKMDNSSSDNSSIKVNEKYFGVPWAGAGGRLAVIPFSRTGRLPDTFGLIECGSTLLDFDLHPFNNDIVCTGTEDAHVKIWNVPGDLMTSKKNHTQFSVDLLGHTRKIFTTHFHPVANNVLFTTSYDQSLRVWDVEAGKQQLTVPQAFSDMVQSLSFNYTGSLVAIATKDRKVRIIDPRSGKLVNETEAHQGTKGIRITYMGSKDKIISVGFSKSSEREIKIWDCRNFSQAIASKVIDVASGAVTPLYDDGTGVVYLAGRGDTTVSYYEIQDEDPYIHFLSAFQSTVPQVDVVMLPKKRCDVKKVEVAHFLKLTPNLVEPLVFNVPRTRLEFFQDDIYPPAATGEPALTASAWFSGTTKAPVTKSLQPAGMQLLSNAPAIVREKKYKFDPNAKKEDTTDLKEKVLGKFYGQMMTHKEEAFEKKKQEEEGSGAADDEWE